MRSATNAGNFSFTLTLLSEPHCHPPHQILATSFDTEEEVCAKYPDARDILAQIRAKAGANAQNILAFGVDAGALDKCGKLAGGPGVSPRRWSKVWFGFPHVGAGHKDEQRNVLANQLLILRFLVSVAPYLTRGPVPAYAANEKRKPRHDSDDESDDEVDDETAAFLASIPEADGERPLTPPARQGSVLITLRNVPPYTLWNVPMLARRLRSVVGPIASSAPALPKHMHAPTVADVDRVGASYIVWRSFEFHPGDWKAYSHRRTVGWIDGVSTSQNEDLLRRPNLAPQHGKHVGTGECRTWEVALQT